MRVPRLMAIAVGWLATHALPRESTEIVAGCFSRVVEPAIGWYSIPIEKSVIDAAVEG